MSAPADDLSRRLRLYLVADPDHTRVEFLPAVESALANGVTAVQLRGKDLLDLDHLTLATHLASLCRAYGALFLVNDRLDIALASGADGVHLGVSDLPVGVARRIGGPGAVIGFSPETDEQAATGAGSGANYLGVGPIFGTRSKADAGQAIGLETLRRRVDLAGIPVIGIGGISSVNARLVLGTGAVGVAVVSAILQASDPGAATSALRDTVR